MEYVHDFPLPGRYYRVLEKGIDDAIDFAFLWKGAIVRFGNTFYVKL